MCLAASARAYTDATVESPLAHVLIEHTADGVVIAFRGTADIRDWITDLDCRLWETENQRGRPSRSGQEAQRKIETRRGLEVHAGFYAALQTVLSEVRTHLAAERDELGHALENRMLWITGHSLGGALAMLCAWQLDSAGYDVHAVYTFGQPRVGDTGFTAAYDTFLKDSTFRFVNEEDVVPRVPGVLLGYRHAGHEVFLPSYLLGTQGTASLPGMIFDPPLWRKIISDGAGWYRDSRDGKVAGLVDHLVKSYIARLGPPTTDREATAEVPA